MFFFLREFLDDLGVWYLIILGAISIAVVLVEPRGIWGLIRRFLPGDLIPVGHGPGRGNGGAEKSGAPGG